MHSNIERLLLLSPTLAIAGFFLTPSSKVNQWLFLPAIVLVMFFSLYGVVKPQTIGRHQLAKQYKSIWQQLWHSHSFKLVFLLFAYTCLSVHWSEDASVKMVSKYIRYSLYIAAFVLLITALIQTKTKYFYHFWAGVLLAGLLSGIYAITVFLLEGDKTLLDHRLHAFGQIDNVVKAGMAYGALAVSSLGLMLSAKTRRLKAVCFLSFIFFVFIVFCVQARGPLLAMGGGCLTILLGYIFVSKNKLLKLSSALIMLAMISLVSWQFYVWQQHTRAITLDNERVQIWQTTIKRVKNPVIGNGIASEDGFMLSRPGRVDNRIAHPHSIFVSMYLHGGFIGLTMLLMIFASQFFNCIQLVKCYPSQAVLLLGLLAYAFAVLSIDAHKVLTKVSHIWLLVWTPIALVEALKRKARFEKSSQQDSLK